MRILWFTTTPALGSNELNYNGIGCSWVGTLEEALSTSDSSLELGIVFLWDKEKIDSFISGNTSYFPVHRVYPKSSVRRIFYNWAHKAEPHDNLATYLSIIEKFKPDLIHIFGTENDYGLVINKTKIPAIIHIQGNLSTLFNNWFSYLSFADLFRYSNFISLLKGYGLLHDNYRFKRLAEREKEIYKNCRYFMGRTEWDRRLVKIYSPESTYFHCDEILRNSFYTTTWKPIHKEDLIIIVSTFRPGIYKGLETICESKRILDHLIRNKKLVWQIVGTSEDDEIATIIRRKYSIDFSAIGIQLLGAMQEPELITILLKADAYVHPSHIDNSPNSLCEAMMLGVPVIATYAGGIPSLLQNNLEGILVQDGDSTALSAAIMEVLENPEKALEFGIESRKKALNRHDPKRIASETSRIYNALINETQNQNS